MVLLIARKVVRVKYQDGSRERHLDPGETVPADVLVPRAVQEHIALGEQALAPESEKAAGEVAAVQPVAPAKQASAKLKKKRK